MNHPETELMPYLNDELAPPDRERVSRHLEACVACRRTLEEYRELLAAVARAAPPPPDVDWARYRAELDVKLAKARGRARPGWTWSAWSPRLASAVLRPTSLAAAALASLLLVIAVGLPVRRPAIHEDLRAFEETVLGRRLGLLEQYAVVERLDLLEDLDVIRQLDGLPPTSEG